MVRAEVGAARGGPAFLGPVMGQAGSALSDSNYPLANTGHGHHNRLQLQQDHGPRQSRWQQPGHHHGSSGNISPSDKHDPGSSMAPRHQHSPSWLNKLLVSTQPSVTTRDMDTTPDPSLQDYRCRHDLGSYLCLNFSCSMWQHQSSMAQSIELSLNTDMVRGGQPDPGHPHDPQ